MFFVGLNMSLFARRGQVTLFVVIAIVLIGGILLYYFSLKKADSQVSEFGGDVEEFVKSCVERVSPEVILRVSEGGGYYFAPEYSLDSGAVAYYRIDRGSAAFPELSDIEEEISRYISNKLFFCTKNFVDFKKYNISQGKIKVDTKIENDKVLVSVKYPLKIELGDEVSIFSDFGVFEFYYRLGDLYLFSKDIVSSYDVSDGVCMSCILEYALENDLYASLTDEGNYVVFILKDKDVEKGEVLRYMFAVERGGEQ